MVSVLFGIALNSWKQMVRDRIFYVAVLVAALMLGFSYLLATLTIVESRKILLDFGFAALSLADTMMAVFLGISGLGREIEHRTIYSVISKPISRSHYLFGKFLGTLAVLLASHILISLALYGILVMMGESAPDGYTSCLFLVFLESSVILAFSFLCSSLTNTILAAGFSISFFLIGRSNSSFETMAEKGLSQGVRAITKTLYLTMPNLERFNIRDVVAYGRPFPMEIVSTGTLYAGLYVIACLAAACIVLERRDLP